MKRSRKCFVANTLILLGLMGVYAPMILADDSKPKIFPPNSNPFGLSYSEWSAKWWQFVFSIPAIDNPLLFDDKCEAGQSGKVWYLTGKICYQEGCQADAPSPPVSRNCTIPAGTSLFFPVANAGADNLGVNPPNSVEVLRQQAKEFQDSVTSMSCEIDGIPVRKLNPSTTPYRVLSPVFDYTLPQDNLFNFLGFTGPEFGPQTVHGAVADGAFLMLKPLSVGTHEIHIAASFNTGFAFDVTYHIDVVPKHDKHDRELRD